MSERMQGGTAEPSTLFAGVTGVPARHTLRSEVESLHWLQATAAPGEAVRIILSLRNVGDGSPVTLDLVEMSGRRLWRGEGAIAAGRFQVDVPIPADLPAGCTSLVARAALPRHDLDAATLIAIAAPTILEGLSWSKPSARHGDTVRLTGQVRDSTQLDAVVGVQVYRQGRDGADEPAGAPFAAAIDRGHLFADWIVPGEDVLDHRAGDLAIYFRVTTSDGRQSAPSPSLIVEPGGGTAAPYV
jgi:hypothetical protein